MKQSIRRNFIQGAYICIQISCMKSPFTLVLCLCLPALQTASAQYYYKDVLSIEQSAQQQKEYKKNRVRVVSIRSYDPDGSENKDFFCQQSISSDFTSLEISSGSPATGKSTLTSLFDADLRVIRSIDSSSGSVTTTLYTYDTAGNVATISSDSRTTDSLYYSTREAHIWQYTPDGHPSGLLRIKDDKDTTVVRFISDTKGNVSEEVSTRKGKVTEHFFYYYNDNRELTDIVRYNPRLDRMLPDYMFEYNESGKLSQMTVVQAIQSNYLVWYYEYDPRGLSVKAFCYDNSKKLLGTIGYSYQ